MIKKYPQKRPMRFFNTTGPCNPWDHYMLPPVANPIYRVVLARQLTTGPQDAIPEPDWQKAMLCGR
jgi:hypothetical protein